MFAALLLLRKGIILNEIAINSILKNCNTYGLKEFETFVKTENCG